MIIIFIIIGLLFSGAIAWFVESKIKHFARSFSLFSLLSILALFVHNTLFNDHGSNEKFSQFTPIIRLDWIKSFNIEFALGLDQLSIILVILTLFLALICVLVSWHEIKTKVGFYYFNLLASIAGIIGVFTAIDMFLFFFFWETMLLPMTAIIAIWGHEQRHFAAIKFFIFTQVSSLLMLIAIITMAYIHYQQMGQLSFYYLDWQKLTLDKVTGYYLMLGFFIAFAVKLPSVPVHSWLPDAHTQAPTAGSVLLAGVLLKTGAYGLIRFVILLFPVASQEFAPIASILGVTSILYGAKMAFAQQDFKRLIAYSSISHMGFVMLALFSFNAIAYQGAVLTMVAHGLSSAALFSLAGMIYSRIHSRSLTDMGGFWQSAPRMGGYALAFTAAAFGLPGLANFIGEFFSLVGAYQSFPVVVMFAALGLIGSAIYGMVMFQNSFQGQAKYKITDFSIRENIVAGSLLLLLIFFGLFPNTVLKQITWQATNNSNRLSQSDISNQAQFDNLVLAKKDLSKVGSTSDE